MHPLCSRSPPELLVAQRSDLVSLFGDRLGFLRQESPVLALYLSRVGAAQATRRETTPCPRICCDAKLGEREIWLIRDGPTQSRHPSCWRGTRVCEVARIEYSVLLITSHVLLENGSELAKSLPVPNFVERHSGPCTRTCATHLPERQGLATPPAGGNQPEVGP